MHNSTEDLLLVALAVFRNQLGQMQSFLLRAHFDYRVFDNLAAMQILQFVETEFIFAVFGPANNRDSHREGIKFEHLKSCKFGFELLH